MTSKHTFTAAKYRPDVRLDPARDELDSNLLGRFHSNKTLLYWEFAGKNSANQRPFVARTPSTLIFIPPMKA